MKLRIGIIGYGTISSLHHTKAIAERSDRFTLTAIHDITPARREAAKKETGAAVYGNLDEFLRGEIDVVLIAVPTAYHTEIALRAVQAGKAVVVEKPMGKSSAELDALLAAARSSNVFLTVHHNRRWDTDYQTVRRVIDEGTVGAILVVESKANGLGAPHRYGTADYYPQWRLEERYGGGKVNEWGSHLIDQSLNWFGHDIEYVWGELRNVGLSTDVDTYGTYAIKFRSGVLYRIETSWVSPIPEPRWYVLGTTGAVIKQSQASDEPVRVVSRQNGETEETTVDCIETGGHEAFYDNLYDAIAEGAEPAVRPEEGALVTRVIEAIRESSRTGQVVRWPR